MSLDELKQMIAENKIETVAVVFSDLYGRLMGKRFDAVYFLQHV